MVVIDFYIIVICKLLIWNKVLVATNKVTIPILHRQQYTTMSAAVATKSASSSPPEPKNENEILSTYRQMQSEMQGLIQNLTKMEIELNEHR